MTVAVNAQTLNADFSKLDKLTEKLAKAVAKAPKPIGEADIDAYVDGCKNAATGALESATKLKNFYSRTVSENAETGEVDVTEKKPELNDWVELGTSVATQTAGLAEIGVAAKKAADAVKNEQNKMKALKYAKPVAWSTDIMPVITEALAEETKAINEIIQTLKSSDNL